MIKSNETVASLPIIEYSLEKFSWPPVLVENYSADFLVDENYQRNLMNNKQRLIDFLEDGIFIVIPTGIDGKFWAIDPVFLTVMEKMGPKKMEGIKFRCLVVELSDEEVEAYFKVGLQKSYGLGCVCSLVNLTLNKIYQFFKAPKADNDNQLGQEAIELDYFQDYAEKHKPSKRAEKEQGLLFKV